MGAKVKKLRREFINLYGGSPGDIRVFYAPGRVNLIGEHTDYNGGLVFPAALTAGTYGLIRPRRDRVMNLASMNFPVKVKVNIDDITYKTSDDWANYPKGVALELKKDGYDLCGCDMLFEGDIPNGAGLSSSASIEVVTALALTSISKGSKHPELIKLALLAQRAENNFVGVNCGIMDQFSSAMGKENHAMLLNCKTMEYRYVPFDTTAYKLVISNTNKRRGLADSKYNERRSQCRQGISQLKKVMPKAECLGDITLEEYQTHGHVITDPVIKKRVEHIIKENDRVQKSVEVLENHDLPAFGRLMIQSHNSLRDLYEVTGIELDTLVEESLKAEGVLGSRMTGAGFGGCTVSLVAKDCIDGFIGTVAQGYNKKTGLKADFYIYDIGNGAREIQ